jgi:ATP-grasp domain
MTSEARVRAVAGVPDTGRNGYTLVLHRWTDRRAEYGRYLDHGAHAVRYVTSADAAATLPGETAQVAVVGSMDHTAEVVRAAKAIAERFGAPDHVVALHEADVEIAAALRARFDVPGWRLADVTPFRDKLRMVAAVADAGLPTPVFAAAAGRDDVRRFTAQVGFPVVVKPRRGMGSRGVTRIDDPAGLLALPESFPEPCVAQSFVPDPVFHVDGVWNGHALGAWRASRYVDTCYALALGPQLASVEEDDPELLAAIGAFTAGVLAGLSAAASVFHLELFVDRHTRRITFLEIGARTGGDEIPFVWREVHGVDLLSVHFDLQVGRRGPDALRGLPEGGGPAQPQVAGWLAVSPPPSAAYRLVGVPAPGAIRLPVYAYRVSRPGTVIPADPVNPQVAGCFRLSGRASAPVEQAILALAARFRFDRIDGEGVVT